MKNREILVVQGEAVVAVDLEWQLNRFGYRCAGTVRTGAEAITAAQRLRPDLILMDADLPGPVTGLDAAVTISEKLGIPVVLITSFLEEIMEAGQEAFFPFGYIVKPFESRELKMVVDSALHRRELEEKLQFSEDRYRSIFEEDLSGIVLCDGEGRINLCNAAFARMFQFESSKEVQGSSISRLFEHKEGWDDLLEELRHKGRLGLTEREMITLRGIPLLILGTFRARFGERGEVREIVGYLHDTTEKKQLEKMLFQAQKMDAVGRLSGGIAHDFNNILTIISGYTAFLREREDGGADLDPDLKGIEGAVEKAAGLTRQLLTFSRRDEIKPAQVSLNKLVEDMEKMLHRLIGEQVVMRVNTRAEKSEILADPGKIEQVLLNLVVNARDAMPGGGRITMETLNRKIKASQATVMGQIEPGEYVVLSLSDTGTGIPPEIQNKIFEPFYTTKPASQGTGLGLSSVYGILKQTEAHIQIQSTPGAGTTFFLYFPLQTSSLPAETFPNAEGEEVRGKGERILLVEDDEQVRKVLSYQLSRAGYQVLTADNAGEALLIWEEGAVDLILTDFVMPHFGGEQLLLRLKRENPDLKAVMMSGHPDKLTEDPVEGMEDVPLLSKPLDLALLTSTIRNVLDRPKDDK
jgi:hypothetical protein